VEMSHTSFEKLSAPTGLMTVVSRELGMPGVAFALMRFLAVAETRLASWTLPARWASRRGGDPTGAGART